MKDIVNYKCFLGFIITIIMILPYWILGGNSVFQIHDQLDIDFTNYILNAKYLFNDAPVAEFMQGVEKQSIHSNSFIGIMFFRFLSPVLAFISLHTLVIITSYFGLYLWLKSIIKNYDIIIVIVSVIFTLLPFYTGFGITVMGLPLLFYALSQLIKSDRIITSYVIILYYGISSSFSLFGYFILVFLILLIILEIYKKNRIITLRLVTCFLILLTIYLLTYWDSFNSILFDNSFRSHRDDWGIVVPTWDSWFKSIIPRIFQLFFYGQYHAASVQTLIVIISTIAIVVGFIVKSRLNNFGKKYYKLLTIFYLLSFITALVPLIYSCPTIAALRANIGVLRTFQFDRVYYAYPFFWYTVFTLSLVLIYMYFDISSIKYKQKFAIFVIVILSLAQSTILIHSNIPYSASVLSLFGVGHRQISLNDFYSKNLFEKIKRDIDKNQTNYEVVSVGLYPSIALYNGFYCLDGYSVNYDMAYKKKFRKIISGELEKSEILKEYYDGWGNRCYVFSFQLGQNYLGIRDANKVLNLDINIKQLKKMNCEYIFSAYAIDNFNNGNGVSFFGEYSTEKSPYRVFVYKIL